MIDIYKTDTYDYNLPEELIAQTPLENRSDSKMLVYNREKDVIEHKRFDNIIDYLVSGDVLIMNNTRVIPARIYGKKQDTGANIELLLLKRHSLDRWKALARPLKRIKEGTIITFSDELSARVVSKTDEDCDIEFIYDGVFEDLLHKVGEMPLPHYIKEKLNDNERYQTVYSDTQGSAAAPTAGLHFTDELLQKIRD